MTPVSVVIITYNEEINIERCIQSVQNVADEIVVVDSFSKDSTKKICDKYNVKFIEHAFEGHIEQKNWAVTQATYPHILSLDADEALSPELKKSILQVKADWLYDGYYFNRLTNYCGKWIRHCGWYPDKKLRLWDSRKGQWGGINPHDEYRMKKGSTEQYLRGDLYHYSYHSIRQHIEQVNTFTESGAQQALAKNKRSGTCIIILKSIWKFLRDYIFRGGFLDGYYGFVICVISAHATFLKYAKLKEFRKKTKG
jgi:glycosyltransferase involved in cell wall biosynthesis